MTTNDCVPAQVQMQTQGSYESIGRKVIHGLRKCDWHVENGDNEFMPTARSQIVSSMSWCKFKFTASIFCI